MSKEKENIQNNFFEVIDILVAIGALYLAALLAGRSLLIESRYIISLAGMGIAWIFSYQSIGLSKLSRVKPYGIIFLQYGAVNLLAASSLVVLLFFLNIETFSRLIIIWYIPLSVIFNFSIRYLSKEAVKKYRKNKFRRTNLLIIADDDSGKFIDQLIKNEVLGYNIKVIFTDSEVITSKYIREYPVLPRNTNMSEFLSIEEIDEVICLVEDIGHKQVKELVFQCKEIGTTFHMRSPFFKLIANKTRINYMEDTPFISFQHTPTAHFSLKIKYLIDFFVSLFALIGLSPLILIVIIAIKLDSKGPAFFSQIRMGRNRRKFKMYKFRSMRTDAEELKSKLADQNEQAGPVFKIKNDPRITKVGKFIRKYSIDELPQLVNVLLGHMSIVGPRPPLPDEVEKYETWQQRRLSMKPGITCIWQVSGRNEITFEEWMKLDLEYIDNWTLSLDFLLILKTAKVLVKPTGS